MRSRYADVMPGAMKAMVALVREVRHSSLEPALVELVKIRASQMNGCAYCVDTHFRAARARHESESRLQLLAVWRDAPCYSDRERAALRWCEDVTLIAQTHASDAAYDEIERWFSEDGSSPSPTRSSRSTASTACRSRFASRWMNRSARRRSRDLTSMAW